MSGRQWTKNGARRVAGVIDPFVVRAAWLRLPPASEQAAPVFIRETVDGFALSMRHVKARKGERPQVLVGYFNRALPIADFTAEVEHTATEACR